MWSARSSCSKPVFNRTIAGDTKEPRGELAAGGFIRFWIAPEVQKDIVRDVFSDSPVPDHGLGETKHRIAVPVIQSAEGSVVAATDRDCQLDIFGLKVGRFRNGLLAPSRLSVARHHCADLSNQTSLRKQFLDAVRQPIYSAAWHGLHMID